MSYVSKSVRLPKELADRLDEIASERGKSVSDILREALISYVEKAMSGSGDSRVEYWEITSEWKDYEVCRSLANLINFFAMLAVRYYTGGLTPSLCCDTLDKIAELLKKRNVACTYTGVTASISAHTLFDNLVKAYRKVCGKRIPKETKEWIYVVKRVKEAKEKGIL